MPGSSLLKEGHFRSFQFSSNAKWVLYPLSLALSLNAITSLSLQNTWVRVHFSARQRDYGVFYFILSMDCKVEKLKNTVRKTGQFSLALILPKQCVIHVQGHLSRALSSDHIRRLCNISAHLHPSSISSNLTDIQVLLQAQVISPSGLDPRKQELGQYTRLFSFHHHPTSPSFPTDVSNSPNPARGLTALKVIINMAAETCLSPDGSHPQQGPQLATHMLGKFRL